MALTPEALNDLRNVIAQSKVQLKELRKDIDDAHRAGIDVSELRKQYKDLSDQIAKLEIVYGKR